MFLSGTFHWFYIVSILTFILLQNSRQPINPLNYITGKPELDNSCAVSDDKGRKGHELHKHGKVVRYSKGDGNGASSIAGKFSVLVLAIFTLLKM